MSGYTREFLICAFLSRYLTLSPDKFAKLHDMAESYYDTVSKDTFRAYCSLDAAAIKQFKAMKI